MVIIIIHEIEKYAFYNCNRIKKIPEFERVSKIGQYASLCCSLLQINYKLLKNMFIQDVHYLQKSEFQKKLKKLELMYFQIE